MIITWADMTRDERDIELAQLMVWAKARERSELILLRRYKYVAVVKLAVPVRLRGGGCATRVMRHLCAWADRETVLLGLSPTTQYGADLERLNGFYDRCGFVAKDLDTGHPWGIASLLYRDPQPVDLQARGAPVRSP